MKQINRLLVFELSYLIVLIKIFLKKIVQLDNHYKAINLLSYSGYNQV